MLWCLCYQVLLVPVLSKYGLMLMLSSIVSARVIKVWFFAYVIKYSLVPVLSKYGMMLMLSSIA